tara:strand:+ start:1487 stop:2302 length:816 start_codon:yes stop_codon:yes gene_type:complete
MQENTESEKPEGSGFTEAAETSSEKTPENNPIKSSDIDPEFEEHDGEVLPPEKKKNRDYGFLILIILLLTIGGGYLYYANQVPTIATEWIETLLKKINPPLAKITPQFPTTEKSVPEMEEQSSIHSIEEENPVSEKETTTETAPPLSEDQAKEHISGSLSEIIEPDNISNISGASTGVDQTKNTEESEDLKEMPMKEQTPAVKPSEKLTRDIEKPSQKFLDEPVQQKEKERNKAVQAYLDFFEASILKLGQLIKTGFVKGKVLLEHFLNKN